MGKRSIPTKKTKQENQTRKGNRQLTKKNVWIAVVIRPMMIALLLFAGSSRVTATDQPFAADVAAKIDNFVFGPQAITVPVGRQERIPTTARSIRK
jgi:hypothetical protein